jgi:hypothetical protein
MLQVNPGVSQGAWILTKNQWLNDFSSLRSFSYSISSMTEMSLSTFCKLVNNIMGWTYITNKRTKTPKQTRIKNIWNLLPLQWIPIEKKTILCNVQAKCAWIWNGKCETRQNRKALLWYMFTLARIFMKFDQSKLILSLNTCTITKSHYYGKQCTEIFKTSYLY